MRSALAIAFFALALVESGCSSEPAAPDLAAPRDLAAPEPGVFLTVSGGAPTPLTAWYSIFLSPPEGGVGSPTQMAITFIDPAYTCAGSVSGTLDAITFGFQARAPGVSSSYILARSGPHLGPATGGSGWAELDAVDDRTLLEDGGAFQVSPGGRVSGRVHFQASAVAIDGSFDAPHCAALDFAAAP